MSDIPAVGIDLGTSNSVIVVIQDGRARVIGSQNGRQIHPSVINFHPDGSVVVGTEAKKRRVIDPANTITSAKRLIGQNFRSQQVKESIQRAPYRILEGEHQQVMIGARGNDYTVPEISALVLRYIKGVAEREIGQPIEHAVITVPANFNDSQREATRIAGEIAGMQVLRVLNEPTAAALAYGYGQQMRSRIVVYDFGGGTFDVTILQLDEHVFEVMSTAGDSFLGGDDIDEVIVEHMVQLFLRQHRIDLREDVRAMVRMRAVGEQIKCNLSTKPRAVVQVKEIAYGVGGQPLDLHFELTQEQLSQLAGDIVRRSFLICDEALNLAKISATQIDDVVMVGGTTRMPLVRQAVQGYFSLQSRADINPDEVIAVGAAIQAAALLRRSAVQQPAAPPPVPASSPVSAAPPPPPSASRAPGPPPPPRPRKPTAKGHRPAGEPAKPLAAINLKKVPVPSPAAAPPSPAAAPPSPAAAPPSPAAAPPSPAAAPPGPAAAPPSPAAAPPSPAAAPPSPAAAPPSPAPAGPAVVAPSNMQMQTLPEVDAVLLDVTPRALGIAVVGGFAEVIIPRNAQIPLEQTRRFSTGQSNQKVVRIQVCQGEARVFADNEPLGQ
ncbi:MAG: Hsp70 family protein, partial [Deltaproteobacteria bacterium]|nr:Hsp70 family protein [Deltaproteobacteria bacterium]